MCTFLFGDETDEARAMPMAIAVEMTDWLMAYDRELTDHFSDEELKNFFGNPAKAPNPEILTCYEICRLEKLGIDYSLFNSYRTDSLAPETIAAKRCRLKNRRQMPRNDGNDSAVLARAIKFFGWPSIHGCETVERIYVWLDNYCYGSKHKGFYYIRFRPTINQGFSTAYEPPKLIVQRKKLRPDQVEYLEQKRRETAGSK